VRLHILTACTRPHNLPALAESIEAATVAPWEVCWHIRFDAALEHIGGQRLKNQMLDQITDGWVVFLDDDTVMHPLLMERIGEHSYADAVVVSQDRADGRHLTAARDQLRVGDVDIGQAVIRRKLIAGHRIPETYEGDGEFLAAVLSAERALAVVFLRETLSAHNALEGMPA
jgi:hypothetical protein